MRPEERGSSPGESHALIIVLLQLDIKPLPFSAMLGGSTRGGRTSVCSLAGASPLLRVPQFPSRPLPVAPMTRGHSLMAALVPGCRPWPVVVGVRGRLLITPRLPFCSSHASLPDADVRLLRLPRSSLNNAYTLCIGAIIPHRNKTPGMSRWHD